MNVLLMHNGSASGLPSGESVVFENEADALRRLGCRVTTPLEQRPASVLGKLRQANVFWSRKSYALTRDLVAKSNADVVHVHGALPDLTVSVFAACRDVGVPVVQTLHNYRWICVEGGLFRDRTYCDDCVSKSAWNGVVHRCSRGSFVASWLLTLNNRLNVGSSGLISNVSRFIAVSNYVKDRYLEAGFPPEKIVVKSNGIVIPDLGSRETSATPVVTFIGRLDVAKGTSILSELPELMRQLGCNPAFNIVGSGPDEHHLRQSMGHHEGVKFHGQIASQAVNTLIQQSSCVVVPSLVPETFGLVVAESLAAGVPVIASSVGGLTELVRASGGGKLVDPHQGAGAFAHAIVGLLESESEMSVLGRAGREYAEKRLDIDKTTLELLNIYEGLSHATSV